MSRILAVSTCHKEGWKQYGRRMVATWTMNWPVPLAFFGEGYDPSNEDFIQRVPDLNAVAWLQEFKRQHPYKRPGPYDYRFDAARFAHKVAAILEADESRILDYLIWVDADTVTHTPVPTAFIDALLPRGDEYIAWLDRKGKYPECGFFILNCRHPRHTEIIAALKPMKEAGAFPPGMVGTYLGHTVSAWEEHGVDVMFRGAPHLLVASAPKDAPCPVQDTHIFLTTFELLASSHGLGTLWDGMFMMALAVCPELRQTLRIPADHALGYAMLFGRPAVQYHRPVKRGPAKVNILE